MFGTNPLIFQCGAQDFSQRITLLPGVEQISLPSFIHMYSVLTSVQRLGFLPSGQEHENILYSNLSEESF